METAFSMIILLIKNLHIKISSYCLSAERFSHDSTTNRWKMASKILFTIMSITLQ